MWLLAPLPPHSQIDSILCLLICSGNLIHFTDLFSHSLVRPLLLIYTSSSYSSGTVNLFEALSWVMLRSHRKNPIQLLPSRSL